MKQNGFTLSELLIALVILGLIATFTIPKVLSSQQDSQRKAVLKETIAALYQAQDMAIRNGELNKDVSTATTVMPKLNAVKVCDTNADAQGCWSHTDNGAGQRFSPGIIMHNGATVAGFRVAAGGDGEDGIMVDWNGSQLPNTMGNDQIYLELCFDQNGGSFAGFCTRENTVEPENGSAASITLWSEIFTN